MVLVLYLYGVGMVLISFRMVFVWFQNGFGMVLMCFFYTFFVILGMCWYVVGMVVVLFW